MVWVIVNGYRKNIEDTDTGESFLCYNEIVAEELVEYLNKKYHGK